MGHTIRRAATAAIATGGALVVFTGTAAAHFCTLVNPNTASNAGRNASGGWYSFTEAVQEHLPASTHCPAGVLVLARASGVTPTTPILRHATVAGGKFNSPKGPGNPAVRYLDISAITAAVPAAIAACA